MIRYPRLFLNGITRINTTEKVLYLSFDDGPTPNVTEKVLALLEKYNAKASFFCKGENAEKYPEIFQNIKDAGHTIGNHSYSHLNAFKVNRKLWLDDVLKKSPVSESMFFRPPYGKLFLSQHRKLRKRYHLVFWDVLTYDYRQDYTVERIVEIIITHTRNGSILVFHDSQKAEKNMFLALEFTLSHFSKAGYRFEKLEGLGYEYCGIY